MSNEYYTHAAQDVPTSSRALSSHIDNVGNAVESGLDKLPTEEELKFTGSNYGTDSGAADAYIVDLPYTPSSLTDGLKVCFKATNANTGACTVNVEGLGVKSINRIDGSACVSGDIVINRVVVLRYNTTSGTFDILNSLPGLTTSAQTAATAAAASKVATAADLVLTNADVVTTHADVVLTGLDKVATNADVVLTGLDKVATNADVVLTGLDLVATNQDTIDTAADLVQTNLDQIQTTADAVATAADRVQTGLDKVATNADVVLTNADAISSAASAAAAAASYDEFDDRYLGEKASDPALDNDGDALVSGALYFKTGEGMRVYNGSLWEAGYSAGSGVLASSNNLSDVDSATTSRTNLDVYSKAEIDASASSGSNLALSGLRAGTLSIDNVTNTEVQVSKTYTGNGSTQSITTGINSEDINWVTGTAYVIGDVRFTRAGTGVTASAFTLWKCNTNHTAGAVGLGTDTLGDSVWTVVADDVVESHNSSRVWIKSRSGAYDNVIFDTSRGVNNFIETNTTDVETVNPGVTAFNSDGFDVGTYSRANTNTETYIAWQEAYHKVMITTVDTKRVLIAFDDVNNRGMRLRQGSGATIELPHGLNTVIKYSETKNLDATDNWICYTGDETDYMELNDTAATADDSTMWNDTAPTASIQTIGSNNEVNTTDEIYIDYYYGDSDNIKVIEYSGTGAAGNEIYLGDDFTPSKIKVKRIDATDNWIIFDNARPLGAVNVAERLFPNDSAAASTNSTISIDFNTDNVTIGTSNGEVNALGSKYLLIAYRDTDADGGGSNSDLPSLTANAQITSGIMGYSDGYTAKGADNTAEALSGTITPTWSEGINYCKKVEGGSYTATLIAPVFGETSSTADYYLDGIWYNSSDVAYPIPISYMPYTFEADIDGNIVEIKDYVMPEITANTINVHDIEGLDKPLLRANLLGNITGSAGIIIPYATELDTHNALNGGIWTCQKDGYYNITATFQIRVTNTSVGDFAAIAYINSSRLWVSSSHILANTSAEIGWSKPISNLYVTKGDTIYIENIVHDGNIILLGSPFATASRYTQLSIEYIGNKLTTGS